MLQAAWRLMGNSCRVLLPLSLLLVAQLLLLLLLAMVCWVAVPYQQQQVQRPCCSSR
jgi:hypothetical protein